MIGSQDERALAIAVVMVRLMAETYGMSDADMNECCARALDIHFKAEQKNPAAVAITVDGLARIKALVQGIEVARAEKPVH